MKIELRPRLLFAVLAAFLLGGSAAAEPYLVRDFAPGTAPFDAYVNISDVRVGAAVYFAASDPDHGAELWRSDGTPDGTFRLTDICPGPCSSEPGFLEVFRGQIYFSAADGVSGHELWTTADRPGTSRRVRDICPGPCSGNPQDLAAMAGRLYFEATAGGESGLWATDGTRQGTALVRSLCPVDCIFGGLFKVGDVLLFQWNDTRIGVWRTDGTAEGTGPFSELVPGLPGYLEILPAGPDAAFILTEDAIWWTDGTVAGTRRLKTEAELGLNPNGTFMSGYRSTVWNGMLITIRSGFEGGEIVRSDGTPEGTVKIGKIPDGGNPIGFAAQEDVLFFVLQSPDVLWRTAGTAETTEQVMELPGYVRDIGPLPNGGAAICLYDSENTGTLWLTDGTAAGTRRAEGAADGCGFDSAEIGDRLLFTGNTRELWSTDGSTAGTIPLHDFGELPAPGGPLEQIAFKGRLLFSARTSETEAPLFLSNGTPRGTREISDEAGWARGFARVGGRVFFAARELFYDAGYLQSRSLGLWTTDGSTAVQVDARIGSYGSPMPVGGTLFFSAAREYSYYGNPDLELFRSDGTRPGTGLVRNIDRFSADTGLHHICYNEPSSPGPGIALAGRLIFVADDGQRGRELWISNGTRAGTSLLRDIDPRSLDGPPPGSCDDRQRTGIGSDPRDFVRFRNGVLFTASDGKAGREIWWTDGSGAGTRRVRDLRPGAAGSEPHDLVLFQGRVWFVASSQGAGEELWRTDGTAQGTVLVRRLASGAAPAWARSLKVAGGKLYFVLSSELAGPELWLTEGAAASIRRVADLRPGPEGSYPQALTAVGDLLVFAADDGRHGLEPWQSDGTAAGTVLLGDIHPGRDASAPGPFTPIAGGLVLTGADDGEHGRELWALPVP